MGIQDKVSTITSILRVLTWSRLLILFLILLFLAANIILFQVIANKPSISQSESSNDRVKLLTISEDTRNRIIEINKRSKATVALHVVTLDFHKNIRIETYTDIEIPILKDEYNKYSNNKVYETPIFTSDVKNNERMLKILNGEFICVPFKETITYRLAPILEPFISDVCYIGIPPYNTDTSGILTIYLQYHPSDDEKSEIFSSMRDISIRIFNDSKNDDKEFVRME